MKIQSLVFCLFCALVTGCQIVEQRNLEPRATAPGENISTHHFRILGDATRKVDHSATWRIDLDDPMILRRIDRMSDVIFCSKYDSKRDVLCDHLRTLYLTGDRLYRALNGK